MERWVQYAFFSMFFAGFTSVIAKLGLAQMSANLGLAIRTCFVFVFVFVFALMFARVAAARGHHSGQADRRSADHCRACGHRARLSDGA